MLDLVRFVLIYTFYYVFFIILYDAYLDILRLKIYFENCIKNKWKENLKTEGVVITHSVILSLVSSEH